MLDRLDELVVKPVDGSGGKGLVVGPDGVARPSSTALRVRLRDDPRGWIAQPVVQLSTVPTLVEDGLRPRHVDLRPFAVNDGESRVGAARRPDARRAPRGRAGRELLAGRRVQGHLGARRRASRAGPCGRESDLPQAVAQDSAVPIDSNPNDVRAQVMQQQQQQGRTSTAGGVSC